MELPTVKTLAEAEAIQEQLRAKVLIQDGFLDDVKTVCGLDIAYDKESDLIVAAAVVLDATTLEVLERTTVVGQVPFPYIPGFLSFRELPSLCQAIQQLTIQPDLFVCDGQGIAHQRAFGVAAHLGVLLDQPTIGVGKTRLVGTFEDFEWKKGQASPLIYDGKTVGHALCTRDGVKPLYVSPGHKVSHQEAIDWVIRLCPQYRQPETTRQADSWVRIKLKALKE